MPEYKETSRYSIPDPTDPTRWQDLTAPADEAVFEVEDAREDTKLYRVLVPKGAHDFGAEFPLFNVSREQSEMDSSWSTSGELPRREVGIVHRVGVAISPFVCDERTRDEDIAKVIANAYLAVEVNQSPVVDGSLETMPIGYGVAGGPVTNGLPAADATPERFPLLYTNQAMRWEGKLSFPHRKWLREALASSAGSGGTRSGSDSDTDADEDDCGDSSSSSSGGGPCVRLESNVLVTFYMTGVFAKVRENDG